MKKFLVIAAFLLLFFTSDALAHEAHLLQIEDSTQILDEHTKETLIKYQIENAAEILGGVGVFNVLGSIDPLTKAHLMKNNPGQVLGVSTESFTLNLFKGMEHPDVKKLQQFLNSKGYTVANFGPGSVGQESTYYGPATADAVTRFQEAYASAILVPNDLKFGNGQFLTSTRAQANGLGGVATTMTDSSSHSIGMTMPTTVTAPTTFTLDSFTLNLFTGMEHADVKKLQQFLNAKGFTVATQGPGSVGQESTYYGPATAAAVTRFQETYASTILKPHDLTQGNGQFLTSTRAQANAVKNTSVTSGGVGSAPKPADTTTKFVTPTGAVKDTYTLTVKKSGVGIVTTGEGQACSTETCIFVVGAGETVRLRATTVDSIKFSGWGESCRGTSSTCSVKMNGNKTVEANFGSGSSSSGSSSGSSSSGSSSGGSGTTPVETSTPVAETFLLTVAVSGSGSVTGKDINCPSDCTETFDSGASVTLTAASANGYTFAGWGGSCNGGSLTCTVSMTEARLASAYFSAVVVEAPSGSNYAMVQGVDIAVPNAYNPTWEFCSELYFGGCDFTGLRDVRYGNGSNWVVKEYLYTFPGWECHANTFGATERAGDHCEVATSAKLGTLNAPVGGTHANMPSVDLTAIPLGFKGSGTLNIESTSDYGNPSEIGAFRIPCRYSHMAFNDPVVYPGQPSYSHLHTFFGNTGLNAYSDANSLATTGDSTCAGGIANRSGYWVPAMIDTATNKPVIPSDSLWYYKTSYGGVTPASVQVMPAGLRMIAGALPTATTAPSEYEATYRWHCIETASGEHNTYGLTIQDCANGDSVAVEIFFPQCWDGVNLDSANHRSHMAYPENGCPTSHPVPLAQLSLNISWKVEYPNQAQNFRISSDMNGNPAGVTVHADFFEAWDTTVKQTMTTQCLNTSKDCHAFLLGNGTMLSGNN